MLLIAVDRIGDFAAEKVAASALQQSQDLPSEPDVDVGGFPFLTQFASGTYDEITVTAANVPLNKANLDVTLDQLRVVLDNLTVSDNFRSFRAETGHATGVLGYRELSDKLGVDLSYAGDERVRVSKEFTVLGRTFRPGVTVAPIVTDNVLSFGKSQINAGGALAGQIARLVNQLFDKPIPFDGIPFDVTLQKAQATAAGLRLDLVGTDLSYRR
ncbi:DUF2993 domain-containing protein [Jatrophihabitans fulvus]